MKKAILLLCMMALIVCCICLKDVDINTILYPQRIQEGAQYAEEISNEEVVGVEEISSEERLNEETSIEETSIEEISSTEEVSSIEEMQTTSREFEQAEDEISEKSIAYDEKRSVIYQKLNQDEQKIYDEILNSLLSYEVETQLSTTNSEIIDKAFSCVMLEHPEIFYVDGYKYTEYTSGDTIKKIVFAGNYVYDKEEIEKRQESIDIKVTDILSKVPDTEDEYLKVKYIYDTLVQQTEYDTGSVDNQNICSVFLNGKSVCQGYAKALQYLLNELGIGCSLVLGTVTNGDGHAWNLVSVNDAWYYLDATWGDAFYLFEEQNDSTDTNLINYDYFCVTTQQMRMTHRPDMPVEMPECISMMDNYYVREGLYFTGYDEKRLTSVFENAKDAGKETVTIKCSDRSVYNEMCRVLLEEQKIFDYVSSDGTVAYTDNEEHCSLTFWLFEGRY